MQATTVTKTPYEIGSSVSSVELLLDTRTSVENIIGDVSRSFAQSVNLDGSLEVAQVLPGPAKWTEAMTFVAGSETSPIGNLILEPATVVLIADLVAGGAGRLESREPTELEAQLFSLRMLAPVAYLLDAVAPGRPPADRLEMRPRAPFGRSLLIELTLTHREDSLRVLLETPGTHLDSQVADTDGPTVEALCNEVPLEISFRFDPIQLRAQEVAQLQPGDIVRLDQGPESNVTGEIDGRPVLVGRTGRAQRRAAVQVVELMGGDN